MAMGDIPEMKSQAPPGDAKANDVIIGQQSSAESAASCRRGKYKWWAQMSIYSIFVLSSQALGTLLGRLYFNKGGNSKWIATLVQVVGFPILIPLLFFSSSNNNNRTISANTPDARNNTTRYTNPSPRILVPLYIFLGIFVASNCMLYSIGLQYLPVTTYSLICASQLGFNALFSYFLNAQKFTPYIVNSLVLLTLSSTILVFEPDDSGDDLVRVSKKKYVVGFLSTLGASAGYALLLCLTQLAFERIFRRETFRLVVEMSFYQALVASLVVLVGLFGSGEWRRLGKEMDGFELGRTSYVMNLVWTAVGWQVFNVGCIGLIFMVSSLFSNVIGILGLPIPPVLAVFIFNDKMNGIKVISMLLAIWGFVSYIFQHYLDDLKAKADHREQSSQVSEVALIQRV